MYINLLAQYEIESFSEYLGIGGLEHYLNPGSCALPSSRVGDKGLGGWRGGGGRSHPSPGLQVRI